MNAQLITAPKRVVMEEQSLATAGASARWYWLDWLRFLFGMRSQREPSREYQRHNYHGSIGK